MVRHKYHGFKATHFCAYDIGKQSSQLTPAQPRLAGAADKRRKSCLLLHRHTS